MFIEPTITWVPSGFSGYIWLDTKIVFKKNFDSDLLSVPLRSNGADYFLLQFIFIFFESPFVLRKYSTDSHQIFRNCVF